MIPSGQLYNWNPMSCSEIQIGRQPREVFIQLRGVGWEAHGCLTGFAANDNQEAVAVLRSTSLVLALNI